MEYGEENFVILMGGLHIEKAALSLVGDLLRNSGWVEVISEAGVFTAGRADAFLVASHITRTRYAHQVTSATLYRLLLTAYEKNGSDCSVHEWIEMRSEVSKQFKFWHMVLLMQLKVLCLVRSFREHCFDSYVNALKSLVPWFFSLNHIHYKRWLPVHIKDMIELPKAHPETYNAFKQGCFTGQKSEKRFSCIALDQIHEQENVKVKGVAGAVSLIEKEKALRRWMVAGPEVANILEEFETSFAKKKCDPHGFHHDEGISSQMKFKNDFSRLVLHWTEKGNPFDEDNPYLINIYDRTVAPSEVSDCIFNLEKNGKIQYEEYVHSVLISKEKSVWHPIPSNKLKLFGFSSDSTSTSKSSAITMLKKNNSIFIRLLLNAQSRSGNTGSFFSCEPFVYPLPFQ